MAATPGLPCTTHFVIVVAAVAAAVPVPASVVVVVVVVGVGVVVVVVDVVVAAAVVVVVVVAGAGCGLVLMFPLSFLQLQLLLCCPGCFSLSATRLGPGRRGQRFPLSPFPSSQAPQKYFDRGDPPFAQKKPFGLRRGRCEAFTLILGSLVP